MKPQLLKEDSAMPIDLTQLKASCSNCALRQLCLPVGRSADELKHLDQLVFARRKLRCGEELYRAGNEFSSIYAIRSGFFKNDFVLEDGREQVMGFHMPGDVLGIDGIGGDRYTCNAVALEDSDVCVIPFSRVETISHEVRGLQHQFHQLMALEKARDQRVMSLLRGARAETRLAAFLLDLSQRFQARGYSASEFNLRMTRWELGSYLGLKLETVSRLFSKFQKGNLVTVLQKKIRILDAAGLKQIACPTKGTGRFATGTGPWRLQLPINGRPTPAALSASVPFA
jgi:CRP/FNR family transcriptional regulator, anaerobic regulatory protein